MSLRRAMIVRTPSVRILQAVEFGRIVRNIGVPTTIHPRDDSLSNPRYPSIESVVPARSSTHESFVTVTDQTGQDYRFYVWATFDENAAATRSLKLIDPNLDWQGTVVVMQRGIGCFVVNLADPSYKNMAAEAACKFISIAFPLMMEALENHFEPTVPREMA